MEGVQVTHRFEHTMKKAKIGQAGRKKAGSREQNTGWHKKSMTKQPKQGVEKRARLRQRRARHRNNICRGRRRRERVERKKRKGRGGGRNEGSKRWHKRSSVLDCSVDSSAELGVGPSSTQRVLYWLVMCAGAFPIVTLWTFICIQPALGSIGHLFHLFRGACTYLDVLSNVISGLVGLILGTRPYTMTVSRQIGTIISLLKSNGKTRDPVDVHPPAIDESRYPTDRPSMFAQASAYTDISNESNPSVVPNELSDSEVYHPPAIDESLYPTDRPSMFAQSQASAYSHISNESNPPVVHELSDSEVIVSANDPWQPLQVLVSIGGSKNVAVDVFTNSLEGLKVAIQDKEGYPPSSQRLTLGKKSLVNDQSLTQQGIRHGHSIVCLHAGINGGVRRSSRTSTDEASNESVTNDNDANLREFEDNERVLVEGIDTEGEPCTFEGIVRDYYLGAYDVQCYGDNAPPEGLFTANSPRPPTYPITITEPRKRKRSDGNNAINDTEDEQLPPNRLFERSTNAECEDTINKAVEEKEQCILALDEAEDQLYLLERERLMQYSSLVEKENLLSEKTVQLEAALLDSREHKQMIESLLDNTIATINHTKHLAKQISTLKTNGTKLESIIQEKDQELIALRDNAASSNSHLTSLQRDVATLTTDRGELSTERDELVTKLKQSLNKISSLEATLSVKEERIQKLEQAKITNGQIARIQQLKDEHSQYEAGVKDLSIRLQAAVDTKAQLTTKLEELAQNHSDETARFEFEAQTLRGELETEKNVVIKLERSIKARNNAGAAVECLTSAKAVKEEEQSSSKLSAISDKLYAANKCLKEKEVEIDELNQVNNNTLKEKEAIIAAMSHQQDVKDNELVTAEQENAALADKLAKVEAELKNLRNKTLFETIGATVYSVASEVVSYMPFRKKRKIG